MQKHLWKSGLVSLSLNLASAEYSIVWQRNIKPLGLDAVTEAWIMAVIRAAKSYLDPDSSVTLQRQLLDQVIILTIFKEKYGWLPFSVQYRLHLQILDLSQKSGRKTARKKGSWV